MMIIKEAPRADGPAQSRAAPIDDNSWVALGLLRQARTCAQDAGADLWDFALEIDRLFETGLTVNDLRWLVAKQYVEHGQELSGYGGLHRSFHRGEGFFFDQTTCVVLTPAGALFVGQFLNEPALTLQLVQPGETEPLENGHPVDNGPEGTTSGETKPCWDSRRRVLSLRGRVVKRFRVPAPNQELILGAFEEEGWPDHIDDPLSVNSEIDPRTRLHDAINRLNGRQVHRLLRFTGNGNGDGVSWEFRQAAELRQTDCRGTANR